MPEEQNLDKEAMKWISPIRHYGSKLEDEARPADEEITSVEPFRSALHQGLTKEERAIYYSEGLSSQIGLHGLNLFFQYSVGIHYYEILEALYEIKSNDMAEALKSCKEVVFGDVDVPVDDLEKLDEMINYNWEENDKRLEEIADKIEKSGGVYDLFDKRIKEYAMECVARGVLTRKYD
jgi:hypothetical protein